MKIRAIVNDDDRFSCEFHAETCHHRKRQIVKQYLENIDANSVGELCAQLEQAYRRDAESGWGDWQVDEIRVSTDSGSLFRVFPCVRF